MSIEENGKKVKILFVGIRIGKGKCIALKLDPSASHY
jgi:hypothetical protein